MVWRRIIIIIVIIIQLLVISSVVRGTTFDLDSFIGELALKNASSSMRTGRLYDVPLPANFSGMEAYVVRFRSGSLWKRGANFSLFYIPPNILPVPFVRRMNLVFENLGNWSSSYYKPSNHNHTLVAPVVGLLAYDAGSNTSRRIEFRITKDPILVRFPNVTNKNHAGMKCIRFGINSNGAVVEEVLGNVTMEGLCVVRGQGHFALVIPTPPEEEKKKKEGWKWWAVGIGVVGGLIIFVGIILIWIVRKKRVGKMQKESDEVLDMVWVGGSRLPYASAIRTQPVLEDTYVP